MADSSFGPRFHICSYLHAYGLAAHNDPQVWWTSGNETWNKPTLYKRVVALSTALTAAGVQVGERVALVAPATCRFLESVLAITSAGAICTPVNTKWSPMEVRAALQLVQPSLIITHSSYMPLVMETLAGCQGLKTRLMIDGDISALHQQHKDHSCIQHVLHYQTCIDQQLLSFQHMSKTSSGLGGAAPVDVSERNVDGGSLNGQFASLRASSTHAQDVVRMHGSAHSSADTGHHTGATLVSLGHTAQSDTDPASLRLRMVPTGSRSGSTTPLHTNDLAPFPSSSLHPGGGDSACAVRCTDPTRRLPTSTSPGADSACAVMHPDSARLPSTSTRPGADSACAPMHTHPARLPSTTSMHRDAASASAPIHAENVPLSCIPPLPLLQPADDAALICFTSGTTGTPKGVVLSHAAFHTQSLVKLALVGYRSSDVYLHLAPLYHIGGLSSALAVLMVGGRMVFLPRYSAAAAYDLIRAHHVTAIIAVPTMLKDFVALSATSADSSPLPSMQRLLVGAGSMPPPLQVELEEDRRMEAKQLEAAAKALFPNAAIMTAYGMSEACSSITFHTITSPLRQRLQLLSTSAQHQQQPHQSTYPQHDASNSIPQVQIAGCGAAMVADSNSSTHNPLSHPKEGESIDSINVTSTPTCGFAGLPKMPSGATRAGWPAPGILLRVVKDAEGESPAGCCADGVQDDVGEVQTKGPHLMSYYWGNPQQTTKAFTPDGWLRTGDMGCLDMAGCLWLVGRKKDMIKSGGENVFAAEVEAVLAQHPSILGVAVVGLPHERLGESVCALVELRPGTAWQGVFLNYDERGFQVRDQSPAVEVSALQLVNGQSTSSGGTGGAGTAAVGTHGSFLSETVLRQHCRSTGLSAYKLPRYIVAQYAAVPVNSSGKVLKHEVKSVLGQVRAALLRPVSRL